MPASVLSAILDHCPGSGEILQGVWDGFGSWSEEPGSERPARGYYIFTTPRAPFYAWPGMDPHWPQSANRIWPPDHNWFIATDIDLDSTLVAGPSSLADALLADERLETYELNYDDELTLWSDSINPPPAHLRPRPDTETSCTAAGRAVATPMSERLDRQSKGHSLRSQQPGWRGSRPSLQSKVPHFTRLGTSTEPASPLGPPDTARCTSWPASASQPALSTRVRA